MELLFLTDQAGVLNKDGAVYPILSDLKIKALIDDGTVHGGMMTKMRSVLYALASGIGKVRVMNGRDASFAHNSDEFGTTCVAGEVNMIPATAEAVSHVAL